MNIEGKAEFPMCPNWRRWITLGEYTISLCGKNSPNEPSVVEGEGVFVKRCPFWSDFLDSNSNGIFSGVTIEDIAAESPVILEVDHKTVDFRLLQTATNPGEQGVAELEAVWNQEVEKFIQRHSPK